MPASGGGGGLGNYPMPTCRFRLLCLRRAVTASRTWWGKWETLLCPEELCFFPRALSHSFSLSTPSDIFSLSPSNVLLLPALSLYLSCHSPSLPPYSLPPSLSVFPSPSLLYSLPFCLPPPFWGKHGIPEPLWNKTAGVCVCVCASVCSCTHACLPARALAICSHSIRFA